MDSQFFSLPAIADRGPKGRGVWLIRVNSQSWPSAGSLIDIDLRNWPANLTRSGRDPNIPFMDF